MKYLVPAAAYCLAGFMMASAQVPNSAWVYPSPTGDLLYKLDERGQRIADFSNCGYRGGVEPLPDVQALIPQNRWVYVDPGTDDDTVLIQTAIDSVAAMDLDSNGWRGVVYLNAGEYQLANTLTITASGVILKGAGSSATNGTRLRATATRKYTLISAIGTGNPVTLSGTTHNLIQKLVPAGSRTFEVDSTSGLAVGDTVIVKRPSMANWIADIDMDQLGPYPVVPWAEGSKDLLFDRVITRIDGNWITVDAPLPQTFESKYGGGQIWRYTWGERIQQVGIEDMYGVSDFTGSTDENHGWKFIEMNRIQHAWVRNIITSSFGYSAVSVNYGAKWITVADSQCLDPVSIIDGGRRYSFNNGGGQLALFLNNYSRKGRHDFVFGATVPGPNAFVNCTADTVYSDTGPHHRWAVGGLFDGVTINGNQINVRNRGNSGTGHGWAGAYMAVWNSKASSFSVRNPPTARNWLVGSIGTIANSSGFAVGADPPGTYDSSGPTGTGKAVYPASLYYGQLQQRMKWPDSEFREAWLGDVDQFASTATTGGLSKLGAGTLKLAGANAHTGTTTVGQGTLAFGADQTLAGGLTFGATAGNSTVSSLDLSTANATFSGATVVRTNSTDANTVTIGSGKTLATNGNVTIGADTSATASTKLTMTGATGSWTITNAAAGGSVQIGGATGSNTNAATVDLSGLGTFNANLSGASSVFRVGDQNTQTGAIASTLTLAATSTIKAKTVGIGDNSGLGGSGTTQKLYLGSGTQIINADTINVGLHGSSRRSSGTLQFNDSSGTLKIRGQNGTSAAELNMIKSGSTTNVTISSTFNVAGHEADLLFSTVDMTNLSETGTSGRSSTFSFDSGTLGITTLKLGTRSGPGASTGTATMNIGSVSNLTHAATLGAVTMATQNGTDGTITGTLNIAGTATTVGITSLAVTNDTAATGGTATGLVAISGGTTTVTHGITLAARTSAGIVNGTLTLSGGTLSVGTAGVGATNGIFTTGTGGTVTTNLTLSGGTLNMNGNAIGGSGQLITTSFNSGTLMNVSQINGGAGLTKATAGTLILDGTNTYSGDTTVTGGTLAVTGSSLADTNKLILDGGKISIATAANERVGSLFFGTVQQGAGTYGSSASGATFKDDSRFSGAGILTVDTVATSADYDAWATTSGLAGSERDPGADPDGDGLTNQQEYAFALNPKSGSSYSPVVVQLSPATGTFSYTRRKTSGLRYKVWTSTTLIGWTLDAGAQQTASSINADTERVDVVITGIKPLAAQQVFVRVSAE
jgi:autotransporter-associated beta strand protein